MSIKIQASKGITSTKKENNSCDSAMKDEKAFSLVNFLIEHGTSRK